MCPKVPIVVSVDGTGFGIGGPFKTATAMLFGIAETLAFARCSTLGVVFWHSGWVVV